MKFPPQVCRIVDRGVPERAVHRIRIKIIDVVEVFVKKTQARLKKTCNLPGRLLQAPSGLTVDL